MERWSGGAMERWSGGAVERWGGGALASRSLFYWPRLVVLILHVHPLSKSRPYRIPVIKLSPSLAIALSVALPAVFT